MTAIFHITNIANLAGILQAGGLWAWNYVPQDPPPHSSAHPGIQIRRGATPVPLGPKGNLNDYVPFYFGVRAPMLLANHNGKVASNPDGQRPIVYLMSDVERVAASDSKWVFTDGHAIIQLTTFFERLEDLERVDRKVVMARYWADSPDDPDRKRRKQAEFLVHRFLPFDLVTGLAVIDDKMKRRVELELATEQRPVAVKRDWYY